MDLTHTNLQPPTRGLLVPNPLTPSPSPPLYPSPEVTLTSNLPSTTNHPSTPPPTPHIRQCWDFKNDLRVKAAMWLIRSRTNSINILKYSSLGDAGFAAFFFLWCDFFLIFSFVFMPLIIHFQDCLCSTESFYRWFTSYLNHRCALLSWSLLLSYQLDPKNNQLAIISVWNN